jgi:hypothetical protein
LTRLLTGRDDADGDIPDGDCREMMSIDSATDWKRMGPYIAALSLLATVGFTVTVVAQHSPAQNQLSGAAEDAERISRLTASGVRIERGPVTAWFSRGAMTPEEMQSVVERLVIGVAALESFVHTPRPWQNPRQRGVTYFFDDALFFIPHATINRQVLLPVSRLRDGKAPLLHETTHALLTPPQGRRPLPWLTEGIAAYVAKSVSAEKGIPEGDALDIGEIAELDAKCAAGLSSEQGPRILPFIGSPANLQALYAMEPALQVRQVFYGCSASFTKYLVQQLGIERVIDLLPDNDPHKTLEDMSKVKMADLRGQWTAAIRPGRP